MPELKDVNTLTELSNVTNNSNIFVYDKESNNGYGYPLNSLINKLASEVNFDDLEVALSKLKTTVGDLRVLKTDAKNEVVYAINELYNNIGDRSNLNTNSKTNLVNAITEVNNHVGEITNLKTQSKASAVNAINELFDSIGLSEISSLYPGKGSIGKIVLELDRKIQSGSSNSSSNTAITVGGGTNAVYYADSSITNKNDCTSELQNLVDHVYSNGGGVIRFGRGDYYLHSLQLKPGVSLIGEGRGCSVLHRLHGGAINPETAGYANSKNPKFNSNKAFIFIPQQANSFIIRDISFVGEFERRIFEDSHKMNSDYHDTEVVDGIKFEDFFNSNKEEVGSRTTNKDSLNTHGQVDDYDGVFYGEKTTDAIADYHCYKNCFFENVIIGGFSGNGIYIGKGNYAINFCNFITAHNLINGIQNNSSDNFFYAGYIEHNCQYGIYDLGGNCKFTDLKVIWNGDCNHDAAGIYCAASRNTYTNVEIQDNYCTGLWLGGRDNMFTNITSDCNGYKGGWALDHSRWIDNSNTNTPQDCCLIYATGKRNHLSALCTQYSKDKGGIVAGWSLKIENAQGCIFQVTEDTKINGADYGCSKNGAVINGTKINSQYTPQSLQNNSVLYIACNT